MNIIKIQKETEGPFDYFTFEDVDKFLDDITKKLRDGKISEVINAIDSEIKSW